MNIRKLGLIVPIKILVAEAVALGGLLVALPAAPAHAEVSAACWAHLAEIPPGETPSGDVRYHRLRGEASPCTEQEAAEADKAQASSQKNSGERRERKSRHCRKSWYC